MPARETLFVSPFFMSDVQKPHAKFRIGKISATVWLIEVEDRRSFYSTTIARTYKDDDGQLKESNSFGDLRPGGRVDAGREAPGLSCHSGGPGGLPERDAGRELRRGPHPVSFPRRTPAPTRRPVPPAPGPVEGAWRVCPKARRGREQAACQRVRARAQAECAARTGSCVEAGRADRDGRERGGTTRT